MAVSFLSMMLFPRMKNKLLKLFGIGNALIASLVIHAYVLTDRGDIIRRRVGRLGSDREERQLLMPIAEHAVAFLVGRRNSPLNAHKLAF